MMDLTVLRVATFLREPWWISIWTISWPFLFLGRVNVTAMWERSFVSLPESMLDWEVKMGGIGRWYLEGLRR